MHVHVQHDCKCKFLKQTKDFGSWYNSTHVNLQTECMSMRERERERERVVTSFQMSHFLDEIKVFNSKQGCKLSTKQGKHYPTKHLFSPAYRFDTQWDEQKMNTQILLVHLI